MIDKERKISIKKYNSCLFFGGVGGTRDFLAVFYDILRYFTIFKPPTPRSLSFRYAAVGRNFNSQYYFSKRQNIPID